MSINSEHSQKKDVSRRKSDPLQTLFCSLIKAISVYCVFWLFSESKADSSPKFTVVEEINFQLIKEQSQQKGKSTRMLSKMEMRFSVFSAFCLTVLDSVSRSLLIPTNYFSRLISASQLAALDSHKIIFFGAYINQAGIFIIHVKFLPHNQLFTGEHCREGKENEIHAFHTRKEADGARTVELKIEISLSDRLARAKKLLKSTIKANWKFN